MGAIGVGSFENDSAWDWLGDFFEPPSVAAVQEALTVVIEWDEGEYLEVDEAGAAVAAAEGLFPLLPGAGAAERCRSTARPEAERMTKEEVTQYLQGLPDEQFVDLLRKVFAVKTPYPDEEASRGHFYLGMATSDLEDGPFGIGQRWGPWETGAVAYTDHIHYGNEWDLGPDWGLCQSGTCGDCGTKVCSNNKNGICPICGTEVYMT